MMTPSCRIRGPVGEGSVLRAMDQSSARPDDCATPAIQQLRVLRICSVYEPPRHIDPTTVARFDPIGGMQNHTAELTRALDRLGFAQTVVTSRPPGYPRLSRSGNFVIHRVGLPVPVLRQFYGGAAAFKIARLSPPDIVHTHLGEDLAIVPLGALASRLRAPVVLTIHCDLGHTFNGRGPRATLLRSLGSRLERLGARGAAAVIVLSQSAKKAMLDWGIEAARVHIIPPGVVPELFKGPFDDPLPEVGRPRIVYVGRIASQKDLQTLIRAIALMEKDVHLVVVGDGPQRRSIEHLAESLGIRDKMTIVGFVRHERVPSFLHNSDVLVLPSMFEELGSILLEGMAIGIPIVASRIRGIGSVIHHEKNGILATPGDPRAFALAIDRVLNDPILGRRLAERSRTESARFSWSSRAEEIATIYRAAVTDRRRATGAA
jgi:glycogen synthase